MIWAVKKRETISIWSHALVSCSYYLTPTPTFQSLPLRVFLVFFFRVRELIAAKMVVEKFLPFGFFSSGSTWQELVGLLTSNTTHFLPLSSRRIKHLLVEMYFATKVSWFMVQWRHKWIRGCILRTHFWGLFSPLSLIFLKPDRIILSY